MKFIITLFLSFGILATSLASSRIMIIPFYKTGESRTTIIEEDPCYRSIETMIKATALDVDLQLIDYMTVVRKVAQENVIDTPDDLIKAVIREAEPDIYIIADIIKESNTNTRTRKKEYTLILNLTAHQTHTGRTVGAILLDSDRVYYNGCNDLMKRAFKDKTEAGEKKIELFIDQVFRNPQQTVTIELTLSPSVDEDKYNFFTRLSNGGRFPRVLQKWILTNSASKNLSPKVDKKIIVYDEILLKDSGPSSSAFDFFLNLLDFIEGLSFNEEGKNLKFEYKNVSSNAGKYILQ